MDKVRATKNEALDFAIEIETALSKKGWQTVDLANYIEMYVEKRIALAQPHLEAREVDNTGDYIPSQPEAREEDIDWNAIDDDFDHFLLGFPKDVDGERYERKCAMQGGHWMKYLIKTALSHLAAKDWQGEEINAFRMDELDAVMHSVDKWFKDGDPRLKQSPANRAADAREIALKAIESAMSGPGCNGCKYNDPTIPLGSDECTYCNRNYNDLFEPAAPATSEKPEEGKR